MMERTQRQEIRQAALAAFDRSTARRKSLRSAASVTAAVALLAAAGIVAWPAVARGLSPGTTGSTGSTGSTGIGTIVQTGIAPVQPRAKRALPSFVEIIGSQDELVQELAASGRCEGVGRDGDRVFLVPCVTQ